MPEYLPYQQGNWTFTHRWGARPAEEFKRAEGGRPFRNMSYYLGLGCAEVSFSTHNNKALEVPWAVVRSLLGIVPADQSFPLWPVSGVVYTNAGSMIAKGDGASHLVFVSKAGSRWTPLIDVAIWSDCKVIFRRVALFPHFERVDRLITAEAIDVLKTYPLVWKQQALPPFP